MLPQAGMAAVETIMVATALEQSGGSVLFNTIIPALVVFELAQHCAETVNTFPACETGNNAVILIHDTEKTLCMAG